MPLIKSKVINILLNKRYLNSNEDIFGTLRYKGKDIVETGHFKSELYNIYRKNLDLVLEILEYGEHTKESKEKCKATLKTSNGAWELVYTETDDEIVLIHIKLRR